MPCCLYKYGNENAHALDVGAILFPIQDPRCGIVSSPMLQKCTHEARRANVTRDTHYTE